MSIKSWLQRLVVDRVSAPLVKYLDGKKTATGAVSLLLWAVIYGLPAVSPDAGALAEFGEVFRQALTDAGLPLDATLFNAGMGLTVVGLMDKFRKRKKEKDE